MHRRLAYFEDREGAGKGKCRKSFRGRRPNQITRWQAAEKMAARRGCGKDAGWKSKKTDFPTPLGNPQTPRIPTFPQPRRLRVIN